MKMEIEKNKKIMRVISSTIIIMLIVSITIVLPPTVKSIDLPLNAPACLKVGDLMFIDLFRC